MTTTISEQEVLSTTRAGWYRALAAAVRDPRSGAVNVLEEEETWALLEASAEFLRQVPGVMDVELASGELPPSELDPAHLREHWNVGFDQRASFFDQVFGLVTSKDCPPYETDYCPQTFSVHRSQEIADIAGFYKAFGLEPSRERRERADHIALELEFMAWLIAKEQHAASTHGPDSEQALVCREAQGRFLTDHLAWWAPAFACALRCRSDGLEGQDAIADLPTTYLGAFARLLVSFIPIERALCNVPPPQDLVAPAPTDEAPAACGGCGEDD
jgi:TorA maturation chaperone TorD